ncbi:hypothetical protein DSECCO2_593730 [anaerobic digester metagenome]
MPSEGYIRKFHSGIYATVIDALTDLVLTDFQGFGEQEESKREVIERWEDIAKDNHWDDDLLRDAISEALIVGDGVFKLSVDRELSEYPIIEFVSGENVEIRHKRGRVQEYIFKTEYFKDKQRYILEESYKKGAIVYSLKMDGSEGNLPLETLDETKALSPVSWSGDYYLCVPIRFYRHPKYPERGMPLLDRKSDNIDALDEVCSQWIDAIRAGRVKNYIPEDLLPKDPETGEAMRPNSFDNQFIKTQTSMKENAQDTIDQKQAMINYDAFVQSYASMLDLVLQGVVSPSSLGIDLKKTDNAEAQREKEKTTVKTRDKIVDTLSEVIPQLVEIALRCQDNLKNNGRDLASYEVTVNFGEYASPGFEQKLMMVNTAAASGIMSVETMVEELWGDSKDPEWKAEEVQRLKEMRGFVPRDEEGAAIDGMDQGEEEGEELTDEQADTEENTMGRAEGNLSGDGTGADRVHEKKSASPRKGRKSDRSSI